MTQLVERKGFKIESTLPSTKKTKEKKSKPKGPEHVKIIDDDAPIPWGMTTTTMNQPVPKTEEEPISYEDAPVVVGVLDERPSDVREKERFKDAKRWRSTAFEEVPEPSSIGPQSKPQKSSTSRSRQKRGSSEDSDPDVDRSSSRRNNDLDLSPPRRKTHVKDEDPSPPRRRRPSNDDPSPPRRKRDDSSPPRRRPPPADDDPSPPRRRDSSPPRRKHKYNDDPRRRETSPPRRRQIKEEDASPPRRRRDESRSRRDSPSASSSSRRQPKNEPSSPPTYRRAKQESPPLPVQPAKSERRKLAEHKEKVAERYAQWGRGVAQVRQTENAVKDYLEQADKPLARYRDDKDLDTLLKEREREDDPMLKYLTKSNSDGGAVGTNGERVPPKPRYRGPDPQKNRFDIWPGYRWDGVDRSNGYEKKLFESIANRHAKTQEAYLWSVEDM